MCTWARLDSLCAQALTPPAQPSPREAAGAVSWQTTGVVLNYDSLYVFAQYRSCQGHAFTSVPECDYYWPRHVFIFLLPSQIWKRWPWDSLRCNSILWSLVFLSLFSPGPVFASVTGWPLVLASVSFFGRHPKVRKRGPWDSRRVQIGPFEVSCSTTVLARAMCCTSVAEWLLALASISFFGDSSPSQVGKPGTRDSDRVPCSAVGSDLLESIITLARLPYSLFHQAAQWVKEK